MVWAALEPENRAFVSSLAHSLSQLGVLHPRWMVALGRERARGPMLPRGGALIYELSFLFFFFLFFYLEKYLTASRVLSVG